MRLKGGKVLLDLTSDKSITLDADTSCNFSLTDEQINAILEKGLIVKVYGDTSDYKIHTIPLIITMISDEENLISYQQIEFRESQGNYIYDCHFELSLVTKKLVLHSELRE